MRRNICKLVKQIEQGVVSKSKGSFKVTSKNANEYTNKILVDTEQYNRPSGAEDYVNEEMSELVEPRKEYCQELTDNIKKKTNKIPSIEQQLVQLEKYFSILMLEDVMTAIRFAKREELVMVRPKLTKLESHLSFKLQEEGLEAHAMEAVEDCLKELNEIINKTNRVY